MNRPWKIGEANHSPPRRSTPNSTDTGTRLGPTQPENLFHNSPSDTAASPACPIPVTQILHHNPHRGRVSTPGTGACAASEDEAGSRHRPAGFPAPNGAPARFVEHAYRRSFVAPFPAEKIWGWLNDPATLTVGQIWPFRVEF